MNTLRTPQFIKIKHCIEKAKDIRHLTACDRMLTFCKLPKPEHEILKGYLMIREDNLKVG